MFVRAERRVSIPWDRARLGLDLALSADGLVPESRHAESSARAFVMPVGPRGSRGPTREVTVHALSPTVHDETVSVPIRWETAGPAGSLFPALDGDLCLSAIDADASMLSIVARYEPPLGTVGHVVDRTIMTRVATATMNALLREVEERIGALAAELVELKDPATPS